MSNFVENLTKHLLDIEDKKEKMLKKFYASPSQEHDEFEKLLDNYIRQIERHIKNVQLQNIPEAPLVIIGSEVEIQDLHSGEILKFQLASPFEGKPEKGNVSYLSPIGKALMLKKTGDTVKVDAPAGNFQYRILSIKLPVP